MTAKTNRPDQLLRVSVTNGDSYAVIALAGESDVYTYDQLRGALESEAAKGVSLLIVDLSGLEFMDSTGVQVLLDIRVMMSNRGGMLALASPQNTWPESSIWWAPTSSFPCTRAWNRHRLAPGCA